MKELYLLLAAFGASGTFISWVLYQRSLSRMIEHIKINHYEIWLNLNSLEGKSPPDPIMSYPEVRKIILRKNIELTQTYYLKKLVMLLDKD